MYPNPFQPSRGHQTITFSRLPSGAQVRIYDRAEELIQDLSANAQGQAEWRGVNQSQNPVASGVYHALIQGSGDVRTVRVGVQR